MCQVTDAHGPAMTWPMYCIGWLEVKDLKQAEEVFMKSFDYIHTEFQVSGCLMSICAVISGEAQGCNCQPFAYMVSFLLPWC